MVVLRQIWVALFFYILESASTALLLSFYIYFSKPKAQYAEIDQLFRYAIGIFGMRILLFQAVVEILIIFTIILYGGWEKFWLMLIGVFASAVIWGLIWGIGSGFDYHLLRVAFTGFGLPLFLGALFAWWFCYKWIGLKV